MPRPFALALVAALPLVGLGPHVARAQQAASVAADLTKSLGDTANATNVDLKGWVRRTDTDMNRWRGNRVGVFIHFGLYSVAGGEWKGRSIPSAAEWIRGAAGIPAGEYDGLMKDFTLEHFDARAWVAAVKQMGGRYIGITTKHHDGFCLWPSQLTDYSVKNTPSGRDVLKELAEACREAGIDLELYYSIIDWHHPDYLAKLPVTPDEKERYARYLEYLKGQCKELLTGYGDIKGLWFDGRWDASYKQQPWIGKELEAYLRTLRPGLILADRVRAYDAYADYNSGYERKLPSSRPALDWECCVTMTENSRGYHKSWDGNGWKSPTTLVRWIGHCASMGGNILLNIGPRGDGSLNPPDVERMQAVGRWLGAYGEAVYGTDGLACGNGGRERAKPNTMIGGPYAGPYLTVKGKTVYAILADWPETDKLVLAGLPGKVVRAAMLQPGGGAGDLVIVKADAASATVRLPMLPPDPVASVVRLEVE